MNQKEKKSWLKKSVLIISIAGTLYFIFLLLLGTYSCYLNPGCHKLSGVLLNNRGVIFIFPAALILSLLTFWMKEEVFRAWLKVACFSAPLIIITMLWARWYVRYHTNFGNQLVYVVPIAISLITLGVILSRSIKAWFLVYKNKHIKSWIPYTIYYVLVLLACVAVGIANNLF